MSLGKNVCGLPRCDRPVDKDSPCCTSCLETPVEDIAGEQWSHAYCSKEHLDKDINAHAQACRERREWRSMVRAGAICNEIFPRIAAWARRDIHLTRTYFEEPNQQVVEGRRVRFSQRGVTRDAAAISDEAMLGAISYDYCIVAVSVLSSMLVWLLDGMDVQVTERTFTPKGKHCQFVLHILHESRTPVAELHTIFVLTPKSASRALVIDCSSIQYGHKVETRAFGEYKSEYEVGLPSIRQVGSALQAAKEAYATKEAKGGTPSPTASAVRVVNDTVCAQIDRLGGRIALFDLRHDDFQDTKRSLGKEVDEGLTAVTCMGPSLEDLGLALWL